MFTCTDELSSRREHNTFFSAKLQRVRARWKIKISRWGRFWLHSDGVYRRITHLPLLSRLPSSCPPSSRETFTMLLRDDRTCYNCLSRRVFCSFLGGCSTPFDPLQSAPSPNIQQFCRPRNVTFPTVGDSPGSRCFEMCSGKTPNRRTTL